MEGCMRHALTLAGVIAGVCLSLTPAAAAAQTCLHDRSESQAEKQRRTDALIAMRLINEAENGRSRPRMYVPLAELGMSLAPARSDNGPLGRVARALQLGSREILPGWLAEFVVTDAAYALHLRDSRDACGLTYVSNHTGSVLVAYPVDRDARGLRELETP